MDDDAGIGVADGLISEMDSTDHRDDGNEAFKLNVMIKALPVLRIPPPLACHSAGRYKPHKVQLLPKLTQSQPVLPGDSTW